ncbi:MAG: formylmethionine deformylase [Elusimicrobia bacterium CG11_big_fil_rev_8_21_14_0_20_64_6]|nr:MAG: formylmethionine deformylase [Elusimicrobia bacterium CG11_big_fil_rev_8_21_14_0_20_64_6]
MAANIVSTAVRKVTLLGHPVLRKVLRRLKPEEIRSEDVRRLVEEMAVTMDEYDGVGIAGNQVGEDLSVFVMGLPKGTKRHPDGIELTVVFNPVIKPIGDEFEEDWEGCLSVPDLRGKVRRHAKLELSGHGMDGKAFKRVYDGFPARVVQHETDHLNGLVYLDRMDGLQTLCYMSELGMRG